MKISSINSSDLTTLSSLSIGKGSNPLITDGTQQNNNASLSLFSSGNIDSSKHIGNAHHINQTHQSLGSNNLASNHRAIIGNSLLSPSLLLEIMTASSAAIDNQTKDNKVATLSMLLFAATAFNNASNITINNQTSQNNSNISGIIA